MGVEKTTYLMFGIRLNKKQSKVASDCIDEDHLLRYLDTEEGWGLIFDGMCDENHFFGKVLEDMDEYDDVPYRIMNDSLEKCKEYEKEFKERFDDCFGNKVKLGDVKPQLMLINHFS